MTRECNDISWDPMLYESEANMAFPCWLGVARGSFWVLGLCSPLRCGRAGGTTVGLSRRGGLGVLETPQPLRPSTVQAAVQTMLINSRGESCYPVAW